MTTSDDDPLTEVASQIHVARAALPTVAFAPEAHLPRERRLLVDSSGIVIEMALGIRHTLAWANCEAVLAWPDRVELVLDFEVSVVVRRCDWHHGERALQAVLDRAPSQLLVPMPDDPEPQPAAYALAGLSTSHSLILWALVLSTAVVAGLGLVVGAEERSWPPLAIAAPFLIASGLIAVAIRRRSQVPARWREAAAVRGRVGVQLEAAVAGAASRTLWISLAVTGLAVAGVVAVVSAVARGSNAVSGLGIASVIAVFLAGAIVRELHRRRRRRL